MSEEVHWSLVCPLCGSRSRVMEASNPCPRRESYCSDECMVVHEQQLSDTIPGYAKWKAKW